MRPTGCLAQATRLEDVTELNNKSLVPVPARALPHYSFLPAFAMAMLSALLFFLLLRPSGTNPFEPNGTGVPIETTAHYFDIEIPDLFRAGSGAGASNHGEGG